MPVSFGKGSKIALERASREQRGASREQGEASRENRGSIEGAERAQGEESTSKLTKGLGRSTREP